MKFCYVFLLSIIVFPLYSQVYYQKDFSLSDNIKKISVVYYDLVEENGEVSEGFPYSVQTKYKTDLNLYYLEFNENGTLKKSRLFYPRDFYSQFSLLEPILDLESSDFGAKINYLTKSYRYAYQIDGDLIKLTLTEQNNSSMNILLKDNFLLEDEYYIYTLNENEGIKTLVKKRKGSVYGFRRIEEEDRDSFIIKKEYINNRFLISKESYNVTESRSDKIRVSQSRINLEKAEYNSLGQVVSSYVVDLSWRNKFSKWPEIDFDEQYNYDSYLNDLERDFNQTQVDFFYDDLNRVNKKVTYSLLRNKKTLITTERFEYNLDNKIIIHFVNDNYKEYEYDNFGNWVVKTIGKINNVDGIDMRVPNKRYIRTLTYLN